MLLLLSTAFAGAPADFVPGVEGQRGFGPPVASADGRVALTRWDHSGLWVLAGGTLEPVSNARGAGFAPVWDGADLYFKAVVGREQQVLRWRAGAVSTLASGARVGQPALLQPGAPIWTTPRDPDALLAPVGDVDLVAPDPAGERLAWDDHSGTLHVLDLRSGAALALPAGYGTRPAWSDDGALLLHAGNGAITVVDPDEGRVVAQVEGAHPRWLPGSHTLVYDLVETAAELGPEAAPSPYEVLTSSLWTLDADRPEPRLLYQDDNVHPRWPAPGPEGLWFVDTVDGSLWRLDDAGAHPVTPSPEAEGPPPPPTDSNSQLDMPYMHQLWDTPDEFDGSWSCGPTSLLQTIARYDLLPYWDITCSWPYAHTSHWGNYDPYVYSYNGYTYDTWGVAAGGDCQGAHGYVCLEYGGAVWNQMTAFLNQHGVGSDWAGTSYDTVVSEVSAGYPVPASVSVLGYGHIIAIRGYLTSGGSPIHSIIVNDPYGNASTGDWGNYDGEAAVYDWPGYNNGYLEIELSELFTAHGPAIVEDPPEEETPPQDTGTDTPPSEEEDPGTPPTTDPPYDAPPRVGSAPGEMTSLSDDGAGCQVARGAPALGALLGLFAARRRKKSTSP